MRKYAQSWKTIRQQEGREKIKLMIGLAIITACLLVSATQPVYVG